MKTIYGASKSKHGAMWQRLRASGVPIISTWIDECGPGESNMIELWDRCIAEASRADATIVYAEPGDVMKGAFVEVGAALASGKRVFWVGPCDGSVSNHRNVTRVATMAAALALANAAADAPEAVAPAPRAGEPSAETRAAWKLNVDSHDWSGGEECVRCHLHLAECPWLTPCRGADAPEAVACGREHGDYSPCVLPARHTGWHRNAVGFSWDDAPEAVADDTARRATGEGGE